MTKILVVDDDMGILEATKAILEIEKYEVVTATSSDQIKLKIGELPDLILLDMLLSGEDGKIIAKKIKSEEGTKKIPIIMLSAYPNVEKEIRMAGADDFIAKPFNMSELLEKIQKNLT